MIRKRRKNKAWSVSKLGMATLSKQLKGEDRKEISPNAPPHDFKVMLRTNPGAIYPYFCPSILPFNTCL